MKRYEPEVVVLEDPERTQRQRRARGVIEILGNCATSADIYVETVTRREVREHFRESGETKWEIALAVSRWFPELEPRLPPRRRLWMPEDERMNLFDAVSFALTVLRAWEWRQNSAA